MSRHPYRRLRPARDALPEVGISESGSIRSLHLGSDTVQSSMNIDRPDELVLAYSRAMMAWLLFAPNVRHITQIGLGGGSFARWIDGQLPQVRQSIVEIHPQVIHIARNLFALPDEGESFEIIEADGSEYIKTLRGSTDIILADGFDGEQIAPCLVSEAFFADCRHALSENGIFAANWWQKDRRYPVFLERLARVFDGRVLCLPAESHGNAAVFAFSGLTPPARSELEKQAVRLRQRHGLDFPAMLRKLLPPQGFDWTWCR